jgi:hypothetical protein
LKFPDFKVCTRKYVVEQNPKWALGDTDTVMYENSAVDPVDSDNEHYGKSRIFK